MYLKEKNLDLRIGKDQNNWGKFQYENRDGDKFKRIYRNGDPKRTTRGGKAVVCPRSSMLTYSCGKETRLISVRAVGDCAYLIEAEIVCKC